jgi:NADH:ubiquinone oxidoreductase subunit K
MINYSFFAGEKVFYLMASIIILSGFYLLFTKKNLLLAILALEIVFNGINLMFATVSFYYGDLTGQMIVLLSLSVAAASFAIGLILVLNYYRLKRSLNIEGMTELRERIEDGDRDGNN